MLIEKEEDLLKKAELEGKAYNWAEAAKLYDQAAKSFLDKKMVEKAAEGYFKSAIAYFNALNQAETADNFTELVKNSIRTSKEAANLYKQIGNKPKGLECEALTICTSSIIMSSVLDAKNAVNKAHELFIEASDLYFKENDQESYVRTLIWAVYSLCIIFFLCNDPKEMEDLYQKGTSIAKKAWKISKNIKNVQYLADALIYEAYLNFYSLYFKDIKRDYQLKEYYKNAGLRCEEGLKLIEGCDDSRVLGSIYAMAGSYYWQYGFHFIEDELEQRKYIDKGMEFMEKGLEFNRKVKDKRMIIMLLYSLIFVASSAGRIDYLQKRIINDLNELLELGSIFRNTYLPWHYWANISSAFYYANIAQWSFFTPDQRKSYAENGIEYAQESMKKLAYGPLFPFPYLSLTMSHSILAYLSTDKDDKHENLKKMLQYAKQAIEIGEKYEGGYSRSAGYNALYRAYKTLADVAENEEEKIEMLTIAAEASKKYVKYIIESRTGIISAQMRLGLLYEEIGILTMNTDTLIEAKELFLQVITECLNRGYQSYAAAAYEYIARIEDRLGNHTNSATYYEKAKNTYAESLKNIRYRPLKKRVTEKMKYTNAWSLIENAKGYHKKENHLKAEESYKNAFELLKKLQNFNYEAPYYHAWASQEKAEQLSRLEKHEKAIEQYEMTKSAFNNAIKSMAEVSKRSKDKFAIERIDKLSKVANLRIKYCSARLNVEKARILGKQGEHCASAEIFALAATEFRQVCDLFKFERERAELEAVYYLCRAWESMELAEKYEDPERFAEATNLFVKASNLFIDSKLKLLASGNSTFCQALVLGCKFDKAFDFKTKTQLYPKIKSLLRNAATSYEKGGFKNGGDWALATSTYFDGAWHLIKADDELDIDKKKSLLDIGINYLKSALELFGKTGYRDKEREILGQLQRLEKEEKILVSALNSIKKPAISSSTVGIIAPSCSLETSQSPRLDEVRQFIEEESRVLVKNLEDSLEIYECDTNLNILHISDIQEGRFGIKEDISEVNEAYVNFLSDLKDKLEILHRKNKIDIIVISGDLTSIGSKEEFDHLTNEFLPILNDVFLKGTNIVPKDRWIIVPGNHDVEWGKGEARFNNFIQFCQENGFHQYKLNNPESIYSRIICRDKNTGNTLGIITLNSCLDIFNEDSPNISNISNSYFSSFSKDWDNTFREMPKLMVCHHTLHSIKKDRFNHALNKLSDNNVLLALAGDIHKSDSHADEISNIRCIPAGTILAKKTERQVGIDEVSRQFNLVNLNFYSGLVNWYTYIFEGNWREIKNESFYLEHLSFPKNI